MMENETDEKLVNAYMHGDEKALELLIARYIKPMYGFIFSYVGNRGDAEDITQDVFLSVWKNIKKFDTNKKFKTWLFAIAKNASINWLKKKKPSAFSELAVDHEQLFEETLESAEPVPEEIFTRKNITQDLARAIAELNPAYQTTLFLYYTEELTFQEIAELENESVNTVKSRHLRALAALREILKF